MAKYQTSKLVLQIPPILRWAMRWHVNSHPAKFVQAARDHGCGSQGCQTCPLAHRARARTHTQPKLQPTNTAAPVALCSMVETGMWHIRMGEVWEDG